jgi:hypothetical protein
MANHQGSSRIPSGGSSRYASSGNASLSRGYEAAERCVTDHPASSIGVAFGAGLGLGLCVGLALKSALTERRVSHRSVTERLGRQVLDAVSSVLPESLSSRMGL